MGSILLGWTDVRVTLHNSWFGSCYCVAQWFFNIGASDTIPTCWSGHFITCQWEYTIQKNCNEKRGKYSSAAQSKTKEQKKNCSLRGSTLMKIHVEYKLQRTMCPSICLSFANENRADEKNNIMFAQTIVAVVERLANWGESSWMRARPVIALLWLLPLAVTSMECVCLFGRSKLNGRIKWWFTSEAKSAKRAETISIWRTTTDMRQTDVNEFLFLTLMSCLRRRRCLATNPTIQSSPF